MPVKTSPKTEPEPAKRTTKQLVEKAKVEDEEPKFLIPNIPHTDDIRREKAAEWKAEKAAAKARISSKAEPEIPVIRRSDEPAEVSAAIREGGKAKGLLDARSVSKSVKDDAPKVEAEPVKSVAAIPPVSQPADLSQSVSQSSKLPEITTSMTDLSVKTPDSGLTSQSKAAKPQADKSVGQKEKTEPSQSVSRTDPDWKPSRIRQGERIKRLTGYDIKETEYGVQYLGVVSRKPDKMSADRKLYPQAWFYNWAALADADLLAKEK